MGASGSKPYTGLVVTFDALGTLYRFRRPVAEQYLEVARQRGVKGPVDVAELDSSFRRNFKILDSKYPLYGYGNTDLSTPEKWWSMLVEESFASILPDEKLPSDLGSSMYKHFSSAKAYELYPDVKPFLTSMHTLFPKYQMTLHAFDKAVPPPSNKELALGVLSNSDPRVRDVLEDFGLKVGVDMDNSRSTHLEMMIAISDQYPPKQWPKYKGQRVLNWQPKTDFQFLMTSYHAGREKPHRMMFAHAGLLFRKVAIDRYRPYPSDLKEPITGYQWLMATADPGKHMKWLHIGDDYEKDYVGAQNHGSEALLLLRDGKEAPRSDINAVSSLDEVGSIIKLMLSDMEKDK